MEIQLNLIETPPCTVHEARMQVQRLTYGVEDDTITDEAAYALMQYFGNQETTTLGYPLFRLICGRAIDFTVLDDSLVEITIFAQQVPSGNSSANDIQALVQLRKWLNRKAGQI